MVNIDKKKKKWKTKNGIIQVITKNPEKNVYLIILEYKP